jgi:TonB-linked SusC/RagA family outer membrane protein
VRLRHRLGCALFAVLLLAVPEVGAQQVTGRVTNQQTGEPLAAVQVFIEGSGIGALSQQNGRFLLLNVSVGTHTLTAERIGYRSVTATIMVAAGQTVVQDFQLAEEALGLDEIIVTGTPGGTQRRAIGNSVTSVSATEVTQRTAVTNVQDLLGARAPGAQFGRITGNVGTGSQVVIRGMGSFNSGGVDPLVYVDGVRVNNSSRMGPVRGDQREVNPLMEINPADIESVEIIKGPAAATLYGTEASAGVIQIITKRGALGDAVFDMSVRHGINYLRNPAGRIGMRFTCSDVVDGVCDDPGDPYGFDKEGDDRDYSSRRNTLVAYDPYEEANAIINYQPGVSDFVPGSGEYVWPTPNMFQNGNTQSYNLEVRGGTPTVRYFLSGNYDDDRGIVWYNWDKKYRMRANVSVVFSENFTLDASNGYVHGKASFMEQAVGDGGEWEDLQWGGGYCIERLNIDQCPRLPGPFQEHMPPDVAKVEVTRDYSRFTGGATLNFTLGNWLRSRAIVGLDKGWDENISLFPKETQWLPTVYQRSIDGTLSIERPIVTNVSADWSSTVRFRPSEALGTATSVGFQYYIKTFEMLGNQGQGFPSAFSRTINQTPASRATLVYEYTQDKSLGLYVQEEFSFRDRLFLTAAMRFDDNSAFGSDFDLETYPKLSATWTVSDEDFWGVDAVNSLRVRGAWGKAGRQPGTFAGLNQYGVIPGPGGTSAFQPLSPGNTEVGPEVSTEIELGFDVAVLEDKFSTEFTWFYTKNKDALLSVPLAPSVGFRGNRQVNIGQIDKWGWEGSFNANLIQSDLLALGLQGTVSYTNNEIKEMGEFAPTNSIRLGWPYPNLTINTHVVSAQWAPAGDARRLPQNAWGDKVVAQCDAGRLLGDTYQHGRVLGGEIVDCATITAGNPVLWGPRFYTHQASLSPNVSLFDNTLRLHVLVDGAWGMWHVDGGVGSGDQYNNTYYSRTENDPKYVATNRCGTCYSGQVNQFDADYVKLRELGATYDLPEWMAAMISAQRASLAFSMREVATLWAAQEHIWYATVSDPQLSGASPQDSINRQIPGFSSASVTLRVSF